mgnify:FL=1
MTEFEKAVELYASGHSWIPPHDMTVARFFYIAALKAAKNEVYRVSYSGTSCEGVEWIDKLIKQAEERK